MQRVRRLSRFWGVKRHSETYTMLINTVCNQIAAVSVHNGPAKSHHQNRRAIMQCVVYIKGGQSLFNDLKRLMVRHLVSRTD